jgi:hypothetical protein
VTASPNILAYADGATRVPRQWSRAAVKALAWVIASPLFVGFPLVYTAHRGWLPQHFLCCNHPEIALIAFVGMPLIGAAWGGVAILLIWRHRTRPRPRGALVASAAIALGLALAVLGLGVSYALKA